MEARGWIAALLLVKTVATCGAVFVEEQAFHDDAEKLTGVGSAFVQQNTKEQSEISTNEVASLTDAEQRAEDTTKQTFEDGSAAKLTHPRGRLPASGQAHGALLASRRSKAASARSHHVLGQGKRVVYPHAEFAHRTRAGQTHVAVPVRKVVAPKRRVIRKAAHIQRGQVQGVSAVYAQVAKKSSETMDAATVARWGGATNPSGAPVAYQIVQMVPIGDARAVAGSGNVPLVGFAPPSVPTEATSVGRTKDVPQVDPMQVAADGGTTNSSHILQMVAIPPPGAIGVPGAGYAHQIISQNVPTLSITVPGQMVTFQTVPMMATIPSSESVTSQASPYATVAHQVASQVVPMAAVSAPTPRVSSNVSTKSLHELLDGIDALNKDIVDGIAALTRAQDWVKKTADNVTEAIKAREKANLFHAKDSKRLREDAAEDSKRWRVDAASKLNATTSNKPIRPDLPMGATVAPAVVPRATSKVPAPPHGTNASPGAPQTSTTVLASRRATVGPPVVPPARTTVHAPPGATVSTTVAPRSSTTGSTRRATTVAPPVAPQAKKAVSATPSGTTAPRVVVHPRTTVRAQPGATVAPRHRTSSPRRSTVVPPGVPRKLREVLRQSDKTMTLPAALASPTIEEFEDYLEAEEEEPTEDAELLAAGAGESFEQEAAEMLPASAEESIEEEDAAMLPGGAEESFEQEDAEMLASYNTMPEEAFQQEELQEDGED